MRKVLILAGEESGLIYARRLAAQLPGCEIRGYADYGFRTEDLAVIGIWAVLRRFAYFLRVARTMKRAIDEWRPDAVCTIDYPGMNLRLAAYARQRGVRTVHVVCPQVWAWKKGRIPKIESSVDRLCCFFPFEPQLFKPGFAVFVGHPLAESYPEAAYRPCRTSSPLLALLPGSRLGEIRRNLPVMLAAAERLPAGVRLAIPAANARALELLRELAPGVELLSGGARDLLLRADAAVVASGTATLEAVLAGCPTVLVYRVSALLAAVARMVITGVKHLGLANIVWEKAGGEGEAPMLELLQEDFTAEKVEAAVRPLLAETPERAAAAARQAAAVRPLRTGGDAVARIAAEVLAEGRAS